MVRVDLKGKRLVLEDGLWVDIDYPKRTFNSLEELLNEAGKNAVPGDGLCQKDGLPPAPGVSA